MSTPRRAGTRPCPGPPHAPGRVYTVSEPVLPEIVPGMLLDIDTKADGTAELHVVCRIIVNRVDRVSSHHGLGAVLSPASKARSRH